jgi:general secretion pathway protein G
MICSSSSPPVRRRPGEGRGPRGFTLVEMLAVILILAVLIALLLPAINGALRTAKNAAVGSEINQLAQALASFKAKYGDYPPSRVLLAEDGDYSGVSGVTGNVSLSITGTSQDINLGQLTQRSVAALRKFFPSANFSTSGQVFVGTTANPPAQWYDFNGNGNFDGQHYILQGHQCLVFFLGGITQVTASGYGMSGFAKNPTNPFVNASVITNRQPPFFEFNPARLALDPSNPYSAGGFGDPQIPGYMDTLGNESVNLSLIPNTTFTGFYMDTSAGMVNFYAYFSSYGNGGYDPNDVNFTESDAGGNSPIGLTFHVPFPVPGATWPNSSASPAPNPYTSALTAQFNTTTTPPTPLPTTYLNPQSFQIISSGIDGLYGVGGQYSPDNTGESLPLDRTTDPNGNGPYVNTSDVTIRTRERDNITNFHNGKLE